MPDNIIETTTNKDGVVIDRKILLIKFGMTEWLTQC